MVRFLFYGSKKNGKLNEVNTLLTFLHHISFKMEQEPQWNCDILRKHLFVQQIEQKNTEGGILVRVFLLYAKTNSKKNGKIQLEVGGVVRHRIVNYFISLVLPFSEQKKQSIWDMYCLWYLLSLASGSSCFFIQGSSWLKPESRRPLVSKIESREQLLRNAFFPATSSKSIQYNKMKGYRHTEKCRKFIFRYYSNNLIQNTTFKLKKPW